MDKMCPKCNISKNIAFFGKSKREMDGIAFWCKACFSDSRKKNYNANPSKSKEKTYAWREKNREKWLAQKRAYYASNKEVHKAQNKKWKSEHHKDYRQSMNRYRNKRMNEDIQFRLSARLRTRTGAALKKGFKVGSSVSDLGCSMEELKRYLESQFQPGMSWENWSRDGWHIDHKKPLASFDLSKREEFLKACHYTNLQPMWASDNIAKGSKIK